jgi:hypothetical protein
MLRRVWISERWAAMIGQFVGSPPPSTLNVTRYGYLRRWRRVGFSICQQIETIS